MDTFIDQLDNSLKNREAAKPFSKTKRYAVEKHMYDEKGNLSYFWLFAISLLGIFFMCFAALVSAIAGAHWFEIIMWPYIAVLIIAICVGGLVPVFKPTADSAKVCLSPNDEEISATVIVEIIQDCKSLGATNLQLQQLQEAAQDANTPAGWWNWLADVVEAEEWHQDDQECKDKEIAARKKISEGDIV